MKLDHLESLSTPLGIFEHCSGLDPKKEHGFCVDDVARGLVVLERSPDKSSRSAQLAEIYLNFLEGAQSPDGTLTNRRTWSGHWVGPSSTHDHWGRALWAWGTSLRHSHDPSRAGRSYELFVRSEQARSPYLRSMMFAALGAAEVLEVIPGNRPALRILADAVRMIPEEASQRWPWPEPRLTYANAVIPEVLMLGGMHLNDAKLVKRGKDLLSWLIDLQIVAGRFSVIPHNGWSLGESLPSFDQQPIEIAALVDACITAYALTSDPQWRECAVLGRRWFEGFNDQGIEMHDRSTGAGYDALTATGRNLNCGAESTLASMSVLDRTEIFLGALV